LLKILLRANEVIESAGLTLTVTSRSQPQRWVALGTPEQEQMLAAECEGIASVEEGELADCARHVFGQISAQAGA
jgi:hypothetical protein